MMKWRARYCLWLLPLGSDLGARTNCSGQASKPWVLMYDTWTSLLKAEAGKSPNGQDLARHYIVFGARTSSVLN